jgi:hypothetical protein
MDDYELSEKEKAHVVLQVDHFIEILSRRYGIEPNEVVDAVRWVGSHKNIEGKIQMGATLSIIAVLVSAILLAMWEGITHMIRGNK